MGRLTWKTPDGVWGVKGVEWGEVPQALYGPLCKLKDYEDVCDSPRVAASYLDGDLGPAGQGQCVRVRPEGDTGRARQGEIPAERWVERDRGV